MININNWLKKHESTVNDVVIDSKEEYVASCGDDGKVTIFGLCESRYFDYFYTDYLFKYINLIFIKSWSSSWI